MTSSYLNNSKYISISFKLWLWESILCTPKKEATSLLVTFHMSYHFRDFLFLMSQLAVCFFFPVWSYSGEQDQEHHTVVCGDALPCLCCMCQDLQGISLLHFFISSCVIINLLNIRLSFLRDRCLLLFFLLSKTITPVMLSNEILKYRYVLLEYMYMFMYVFVCIYFSRQKDVFIISVISCHVLQTRL